MRIIYTFMAGFMLMLTLSLYSDYTYEREVIDNLRNFVYQKAGTRDITTLVDTALYYSKILQQPNSEIYGDKNFSTFKQILTPSSFTNFYFGKGVCGAYSSFFMRVMKSMGYETKVVQITSGGVMGAHMAIAIVNQGKLLIVDPLFDHNFKDQNGNMSDIHDVAKNWYSYYQYHLPADYPKGYNYQEGWTYSNWRKFGVVSRSAYGLCSAIFGKQRTNNFCLRYYTQGFTRWYLLISFLLFAFTCIKAVRLSFSGHTSKNFREALFSRYFVPERDM